MTEEITFKESENKEEKPELQMVIYPNKFLRFRAVPFTDEQITTPLVKNIAQAMVDLMYKYKGVGIAAQQAGVPNSICVIDPHHHNTGKKDPLVLINPVIKETELPAIEIPNPGEGCLSLPYGFKHPIPRFSKVTVEYKDLKANSHTHTFEGAAAIVVQHEIDHLMGILFPDRLSRLKRDIFERKVKKVRRRYKKGFKAARRQIELKQRSMKRFEKAQQRKQDRLDAIALKESRREWGNKGEKIK